MIDRSLLRIGTRRSPLAVWQTEFIRDQILLRWPGLEVEIVFVLTEGDRSQASETPIPLIGGKGLFTKELEDAMRRDQIDLAVHCLKDLPTLEEPGLKVVAVTARESVWDVLVSERGSLAELPKGAVVGTSSVRRSSQLLRVRPDLEIRHIRGNIDSRLKKIRDLRLYDAIVMAEAGLNRLGLQEQITERFSADVMLPAPGQGALAIQCRAEDFRVIELVSFLNHAASEAGTGAERRFLHDLGAGCNTPVAAYAEINQAGRVVMHARCLSVDGKSSIDLHGDEDIARYRELGAELAREALRRGFEKILARCE